MIILLTIFHLVSIGILVYYGMKFLKEAIADFSDKNYLYSFLDACFACVYLGYAVYIFISIF